MGETVAVNVTVCPYVEGLRLEVKPVVVPVVTVNVAEPECVLSVAVTVWRPGDALGTVKVQFCKLPPPFTGTCVILVRYASAAPAPSTSTGETNGTATATASSGRLRTRTTAAAETAPTIASWTMSRFESTDKSSVAYSTCKPVCRLPGHDGEVFSAKCAAAPPSRLPVWTRFST